MHQQPIGFSLDLAAPGGPPATVQFRGMATFATHLDPSAAIGQIGPAVQQATFGVLQEKLQGYQVALPTLAGSLPHFLAEIVGRAGGLANQGIILQSLTLDANVPQAAVAPAAGQVMTGSQIAANVAGNFANNAVSAAVSSIPQPRIHANVGGFHLHVGPGAESIEDQVNDELKDRMIMYAVVGGALLLITGICLVTLVGKLFF